MHCVFHGLRKAALTRLADAGCTTHEFAAISGHKTLSEVERYTKGQIKPGSPGPRWHALATKVSNPSRVKCQSL